jgi:hypothetical protein
MGASVICTSGDAVEGIPTETTWLRAGAGLPKEPGASLPDDGSSVELVAFALPLNFQC